MKKLLIATLATTLALTACQKPAEKPAEPKAETPAEQAPVEQTAQPAPQEGEHAHKEGEHKEGEHAHHDHNHAHHNHDHHDGDAYQCGDKAVNIVVHNHEGEMEAHAIIDDIEYDLPADTAKPNHYTTAEGLNNQAMVMHLDGDKATFKASDDKVLLECQKTPKS